MNKNAWIATIAAAVVFGGGGFWGGMSYAHSQKPSFAGGAAAFAGRGGAAGKSGFGGGAVMGTILSTGDGTLTLQMPIATTTGAESGTKIVLFSSSTQIDAMQSVPASILKAGTSIIVTGTPNSDGSITANSIQVRPEGQRGAPMIRVQQ